MYCNDDKRESAEKTRLRRVRFIFVNLKTNLAGEVSRQAKYVFNYPFVINPKWKS